MSNVDFISDQFAAAISNQYRYIINVGRWYVKRGQFWECDNAGTIRQFFREWCRQRADVSFTPKACDDVLKTLATDPHVAFDVRAMPRESIIL